MQDSGQGSTIKANAAAPRSCSAPCLSHKQKPPNMKLFIVLFALVAVAAAFPGYGINPWAGSSAWQPQSAWPSSGWQPEPAWPSSGWQPKSVWPSSGWAPSAWQAPIKHHVEHVQVLQVAQPAPIPALHPHPLKLDSHTHVVRIPLHGNKIAHPHLVGVEHYHEPQIQVKAVHGHGW